MGAIFNESIKISMMKNEPLINDVLKKREDSLLHQYQQIYLHIYMYIRNMTSVEIRFKFHNCMNFCSKVKKIRKISQKI